MGIIKPFLPEDVRVKLQDKIREIFETAKGKVEKEDIWGKKHLAYKVAGHEEGYYVVYHIDLPQDKAEEVQEELKAIGDLLRFMLIKKD